MGATPGTLEERFWRYAGRGAGCWTWAGGIDRSGYGRMGVKVRRGKHNHVSVSAHRVSWMIHRGEIPKGLCVLHKCDNRLCTNPDHLFLGTRTDNNRDMVKKNRHCGAPGPKNPQARLTPEQVAEIRALPRRRGVLKEISEKYGITRAHASDIRCGYAWPFPGAPKKWRKKRAEAQRQELLTQGGP